MTRSPRALLALAIAAAVPAQAQQTPSTLPRVTVEAARLQGVSAFDTPASLDRVDLRAANASPGVNLSERLAGMPGLLARDRQNYAQDTQLSIRGFGARATFGVRGVRLYADGVPATMPDGQGQLSHFNLMGGDRVEVLRGPFSALYGNSSGGVLQFFSADGASPDEVDVRAGAGSHGSRSLGARWLGRQGRVDYNLAASVFDTDGYREHSAARRESFNGKLGVSLGEQGRLQLVGNHVNLPDAQDPLGLSRAQWQADPRQATGVALQFNTRKSVRQDQLGLVLDLPVAQRQKVHAVAYGGQREVRQYLALPVAAQANPLNSGGVIDLANDYGGLDARWSWQGQWAGRDVEATAGASADRQIQQRRGYENFVGDQLGVQGALRRDERNRVENRDLYAQLWWQLAPAWSVLVGARRSAIDFASVDHYVRGANPDDSGSVRYAETTPVAGVMFAPTADWRVYASLGRGFETPTFNEVGYRADGGAGLALDLQPAISRHAELGSKWRGDQWEWDLALFRADTDDELSVASNLGGRSTYRNVGQARRQGIETAVNLSFGQDWQWQLAYTWLQAEFRDGFLTCARSGCATPDTPVAAGARIPGTARHQFFSRLAWQPAVWSAAAEVIAIGDVSVNDIGSESAPGYALVNLEAGRRWQWGASSLRAFARVDNALDRDYVGSVIVNEGNARYYEPGPDRSVWLGLEWRR
ncbi:TonB-dependent receptor domain-containing protein [Pseudoxanthomonas indica]|uniref:Iron complex outermembrane recepter protein n=1 Tax=Pseudoxanthomonas indica TaxID=428993 RepID=A0A1T5KN88_9GAMM|nr:TonB-dependent receptor [Pseudoxanthomonas indica]GGD50362.1 ligand-gated channel [Pseudoxanthomonas indica]SKC65130.1 iron complex outermembrane recepter protein [Pseudoxanthomonas indica]